MLLIIYNVEDNWRQASEVIVRHNQRHSVLRTN